MTNESGLDYEEVMKALGERIKKRRQQQGLSLRDMVVKHSFHDSQWRRFERSGASNLGSLLRIAKVLNTSVSMLLDGLGEYPSAALVKMKTQSLKESGTQKAEAEEGNSQERRSGKDRRVEGDRRKQ